MDIKKANKFIRLWVDIPNYEGLYLVSTDGQVKNSKGRKIKPTKDKEGYLRITLTKNGKQKSYGAHRLVALAFLPNPENKLEVDHKDTNVCNNNVTNLQWVTRTENRNNPLTMKHSSKCVYCIELQKYWLSQKECSEELDISKSSISSCCKGRQKQAKGYTFRYATEEEIEECNNKLAI